MNVEMWENPAMQRNLHTLRGDGVFLAGIVVTGGIWLRLADAVVTATEPYLLPVAILNLLLVAVMTLSGWL